MKASMGIYVFFFRYNSICRINDGLADIMNE